MNINNHSNTFTKTGAEFKLVLKKRIIELRERLSKRNIILDKLLEDKRRLRSYLLRSGNGLNPGTQHRAGVVVPTVYGKDHIGIEEVEEIKQLCGRVFQIENEIATYETLVNNVKDQDSIRLTLQELMQYGFE